MEEFSRLLKLKKYATSIYLNCLGEHPRTISELRLIVPKLSKKEFNEILNQLLEKKFLIKLDFKNPHLLPHYIAIPPFGIVLRGIHQLRNFIAGKGGLFQTKINNALESIFHEQNIIELNSLSEEFQKIFKDIEKDIERIRDELNQLTSDAEDWEDTSLLFLKKFEEELKNIINSQLASILVILFEFKEEFQEKYQSVGITHTQWDSIKNIIKDIFAGSIHEKAKEINEIITEQFKDIKRVLDDKISVRFKSQLEQKAIYLGILNLFKNELKKIEHLINSKCKNFQNDLTTFENLINNNLIKASKDFIENYLENIEIIEKILYKILEDFSDLDKFSSNNFWQVNSLIKLREEIAHLLNVSKTELLIIIPKIKEYLPLEYFKLDYSEPITEKNEQSNIKKQLKIEKALKENIINKELINKLKEEFKLIKKKVIELKGFELSHNLANIIAIISEINPKSIVFESMQSWLNRLLVIRKYLDQNLRYLFLEDIEKWEKDYQKISIQKETSLKKEIIEKQPSTEKSINNLIVKIISSTPFKNIHVRALQKKDYIQYKKLKHNNLIGILADKSYLILGTLQISENEKIEQINAISTDLKPLVEVFSYFLEEIWKKAKLSRKNRIDYLIKEIFENLNNYSGKKIGTLIQEIINLALKKKKVSLSLLEIKLFAAKLKKIETYLEKKQIETLIENIEMLNEELTKIGFHFNIPYEYVSSLSTDLYKRKISKELKLDDFKEEIISNDKINEIFNKFLINLDILKGSDISEQLQDLFEFTLKFQGASKIIHWKNKLISYDNVLSDSYKTKLKEDLLKWKEQILISKINQEKKEIITPEIFPNKEKIFSEKIEEKEKNTSEKEIKNSIYEELEFISKEINNLQGFEISRKLQNVLDDIIENEGFSLELKDIKNWIGKFRVIKKRINEEMKEQFLIDFNKFLIKYSPKKSKNDEIGDVPSFISIEDNPPGELPQKESENLTDKFDNLIKDVNTDNGQNLSRKLQNISDILLLSHGAVALSEIRQWISKLRSYRDILEDKIKLELIERLQKWKEKFI
ncbi:MAG: hypothetical protein ACTSPD_19070 [Promethearchaeota archaeon]